MPWSDTVGTVLSGTGVASLIGAVVMIIRTRQQGRVVEANVIERLSSTVGDFAEDVRRDAKLTIDEIRRDAKEQIERATDRAERAEARAVAAERSAMQSQLSSMEAAATVRRLTLAITSPYASLEGLRAMVESGGSAINGKG